MQTLVAYHEDVDASAGLVNIAAVVDPHVRTLGDYIYVPEQASMLLGAYAFGVTPLLAQLRSPSIRTLFHQELTPMGAAVIPSTPQQLYDCFDDPIPLLGAEPMEALMQAGAAAQHNSVIVILGDGKVTYVSGDIRTIRATTTVAAVAGAWTNVPLIFADTLPSGRYQLVGMKGQSTTMLACRALVPGQYLRPGVLGQQAANDIQLQRFRRGWMGVLGEFMHDNPPTIDILCNAADAANTMSFWLDLIYLGK